MSDHPPPSGIYVLVKAEIPVLLDAASAMTVCSKVRSTGVLVNDLLVRLTDNAPDRRIYRTPG